MPELSNDQLQSILTEVRANKLIEAIKHYREYTGVGLAEAKSAVEQLAAGNVAAASAVPGLTDDQLQSILTDLGASGKIQAIKRYREYTGAGLADAKTVVEQIAAANKISLPKSGCGAAAMFMAVGFVAVSLAVYFLIRS